MTTHRHRTGRRTVLAAATVVVIGVSGGVAIAGSASAAGTGTCTATVNVRSEPAAGAPVVGTCRRGQSTRVGAAQGGFVRLDEFGGWASARYVSTGSGAGAPNTAR